MARKRLENSRTVATEMWVHRVLLQTSLNQHSAKNTLSQTTRLTLPLHQRQDIAFTDGSLQMTIAAQVHLHVSDDASLAGVHERDANLGFKPEGEDVPG